MSFIPADSGKATAKTKNAIVRNKTCKFSDPIYETTRLIQDTKANNMMRSFTNLSWPWVFHVLASLVRLLSILLIMLMHSSLQLFHCLFMDAVMEQYYIMISKLSNLDSGYFDCMLNARLLYSCLLLKLDSES